MTSIEFIEILARRAACIALCALGACTGGGTTTSPGSSSGPQSFTIAVGGSVALEAVQALRFYPNALTVDVGDTVTWAFPSGEPHTDTLLGPKTAFPPPNDPTNPNPFGGSTAGTPYPASNGIALSGAAASQSADLALGTTALSQFPYAPGGPHLAAGITPNLASGAPSAVTVLRFLDGPSLDSTTVTIHTGDVVTWTNQSNNAPHTVTIAAAGAPFPNLPPFTPPSGGNVYDGTKLVNSGVLQPGASFSLQFTKPGTYTYHCLFHDDTENMIGTVIVQ